MIQELFLHFGEAFEWRVGINRIKLPPEFVVKCKLFILISYVKVLGYACKNTQTCLYKDRTDSEIQYLGFFFIEY